MPDDDDQADADDVVPDDLRAAVAARLQAVPADLILDVTKAQAPGLTLFTAHLGRRARAGLWDGETVELDAERAIQRVADAWGLRVGHGIPAAMVAQVVGLLEGNPGAAYLDQEAIEVGGDPSRMTVPHDVVVDGAPGVVFWTSTSRLAPYRCTFLVHPDGRAEVRRG